MIESSGVLAAGDLAAASRIRALELLDEQHRRIAALILAVDDGRQMLHRCTAALAWRAPSRVGFDIRVTELDAMLARATGGLQAARTECDRARDLLRAYACDAWRADGAGPLAGGSVGER